MCYSDVIRQFFNEHYFLKKNYDIYETKNMSVNLLQKFMNVIGKKGSKEFQIFEWMSGDILSYKIMIFKKIISTSYLLPLL